MTKKPLEAMEEHFSKVSDPRTPALAGGAREDRVKKHKLIDVIMIAICAVICFLKWRRQNKSRPETPPKK